MMTCIINVTILNSNVTFLLILNIEGYAIELSCMQKGLQTEIGQRQSKNDYYKFKKWLCLNYVVTVFF